MSRPGRPLGVLRDACACLLTVEQVTDTQTPRLAAARKRMRRVVRLLLGPEVLVPVGCLLFAVVTVWVAAFMPRWDAEALSREKVTAATGRVTNVLAEESWAALEVDLPNGKQTLVRVEPGTEFGDQVDVYRASGDGDWTPGVPERSTVPTLILSIALESIAFLALVTVCWFLLEDVALPARDNGSRYYREDYY